MAPILLNHLKNALIEKPHIPKALKQRKQFGTFQLP
jgi:hypothetical protein